MESKYTVNHVAVGKDRHFISSIKNEKMKKYCDYYYTLKVEKIVSTNNSAPLKKYSWTVREKNGKKIYSSLDDDGVFPTVYDSKVEAESDCRESIQDHYL